MRSTSIALLVLILFTSSLAQRRRGGAESPPESREAADQAGIRKLQEQDIAANMSYDVNALADLWTDDGVLLVPNHAPIKGTTGLRNYFKQQLDALGNADILAYDQQWQEVRILGDYAYEWGQIETRHRSGQGKVETSATYNAMRILKRGDDGSWRIARAILNEARASTSLGAGSTPQ